MQDGVCVARQEGTPQGGPLSPLLANLLLDDLDKELERRGHRFCRHPDDGNIYVRSQAAGERVPASRGQPVAQEAMNRRWFDALGLVNLIHRYATLNG
jgi:hypothetical protein